MIHEGHITLDGTLDEIRHSHQRSSIRFSDSLELAPKIDGTLSTEGGGRSWHVIHNSSIEQFKASLAQQGGELVESRDANLQEIFLARVGRGRNNAEAA